jgi:hypothetical protein
MIGDSELFTPLLLNDDYDSGQLIDVLRELFGDEDDWFAAKVIYDDGREPNTYRNLVAASDSDFNSMNIVDFTDSEDREPATTSALLTLRFDEVTLTFETRDDWTVEWFSNNCVSLTAARVGDDHIKQVIFSIDED